MSRRGLFSLLNMILLGASLAVMLFFPQYAAFALYAIIGWIAAGLTLTWSGWGTHGPSSAGGAPSPPAFAASAPPAAFPAGATPAPIDFCVFCGSYFSSGQRSCANCGKPLPRAVVG